MTVVDNACPLENKSLPIELNSTQLATNFYLLYTGSKVCNSFILMFKWLEMLGSTSNLAELS